VWFNFNYADLSKSTGISHTTLRKRIKALLQLGWLTISEDNTLRLKGINKLKESYDKSGLQMTSPIIKTPVGKTKKEQILIFRSVLIGKNLNHQAKKVKRLNKIVEIARQSYGMLNKKQLLILTTAGGLKKLNDSIEQKTVLSNKVFGELVERSKATGARLQSDLRKAGFIQTNRRFKEIATNVSRLEYLYNYLPQGIGLLYSEANKTVVKRQANEVSLIFS